jgi:hypothetical protein
VHSLRHSMRQPSPPQLRRSPSKNLSDYYFPVPQPLLLSHQLMWFARLKQPVADA